MPRHGVRPVGVTELWAGRHWDPPNSETPDPARRSCRSPSCLIDEMRIKVRCRLCESSRLLSVLDLGATPPCETFLTADELDQPEPTFPLHLRLCEDCLLLQIPALITPEDTFAEYAYFSSYSDSWVDHAKRFVDDAVSRLHLDPDSFVVEVASNDGYLLQHVVAAGIPCLGIEPSVNVGAAARKRGVPTQTD